MTFPKQRRPLLMLIPSFINYPVAPVFLILSDPAKSTKVNFAVMFSSDALYTFSSGFPSSGIISPMSFWIFCEMVTTKIAWDLEETSFIRVECVCLKLIPLFNKFRHSSLFSTSSSFIPYIVMAPFFSSLICNSFKAFPVILSTAPIVEGSKRSWSSSL